MGSACIERAGPTSFSNSIRAVDDVLGSLGFWKNRDNGNRLMNVRCVPISMLTLMTWPRIELK